MRSSASRWRLRARIASALAAAFALSSLAVSGLARQGTSTPGPTVWLDAAGAPLPFREHPEIAACLREAEVVDRRPIGRGVTGAERVVLARGGLRLRAAFRTVERTRRGPFENLPPSLTRVRDSAAFECAAYELSEALGLGRVPPTVWRSIDGKQGSVQIWLEGGMTETDLAERSLDPPEREQWLRQKQRMYVFDALVANLDRNRGNVLVDRSWTLWLIDHTRAFAQTSELLGSDRIKRCPRDLWIALRGIETGSLRLRLEPFLTGSEIGALLKRRQRLVAHIETLIAANGEAAVLF